MLGSTGIGLVFTMFSPGKVMIQKRVKGEPVQFPSPGETWGSFQLMTMKLKLKVTEEVNK